MTNATDTSLRVVTGNLIELAKAGEFDVIVHGCNCFCTMGAGIARHIREQFPLAYQRDQATIVGSRQKLGTYTYATCGQLIVVNAYTQFGIRTQVDQCVFDYDAFDSVLGSLESQFADTIPACRFGFPLIGCGLAGGDKTEVIRRLAQFADKVVDNGCSVTLVVME